VDSIPLTMQSAVERKIRDPVTSVSASIELFILSFRLGETGGEIFN